MSDDSLLLVARLLRTMYLLTPATTIVIIIITTHCDAALATYYSFTNYKLQIKHLKFLACFFENYGCMHERVAAYVL